MCILLMLRMFYSGPHWYRGRKVFVSAEPGGIYCFSWSSGILLVGDGREVTQDFLRSDGRSMEILGEQMLHITTLTSVALNEFGVVLLSELQSCSKETRVFSFNWLGIQYNSFLTIAPLQRRMTEHVLLICL